MSNPEQPHAPAAEASLTIEANGDRRLAILTVPCLYQSFAATADDHPRGGPIEAVPVNIAATVLTAHLRDCGCEATAELERRYAPIAARIREHGGWNSYDD
jgi:hypothetical protein